MEFLRPIFPDYVWVVGLSMMAFGYVMATLVRAWIRRRRFLRTNESGVEEFESYGASVWVTLYERSVEWLSCLIDIPMMFCGIAIMVVWLIALTTDPGELTYEMFRETVDPVIGWIRKVWELLPD